VDHDEIEQVKMIRGEIKGQRKEKKEESRGPEENHAAFEQLNVLVVIAFHVHIGTPVLQNENQKKQSQHESVSRNGDDATSCASGLQAEKIFQGAGMAPLSEAPDPALIWNIVVTGLRMCYEPAKIVRIIPWPNRLCKN
jgi:hypothetical protein